MRLTLALAVLLASTAAVAQQAPSTVPLIERAKLFGNPNQTQGRISPDGQWLSWIAPSNGVLNVWVAPTSDPSKARVLTTEKVRPIRQHFWSPDSRMVMFVNDSGGDENFLLYGVDVASARQTNFTPFQKTRVEILGTSNRVKDRILVGVNNRDPRWHDVHSLDLGTGKLTLVQDGTGYGGFVADEDLNLRVAIRPNADGGNDYFRIEQGKVADKPFLTHGIDDSQTVQPLGFSADGRTLYWIDSRDRNTAALMAMDFATGAMTKLAEDQRADVQGLMSHPMTNQPQAVAIDYAKPEWRVLDPAVKADVDLLNQRFGTWQVVSRTDKDDRWVVAASNSTAPTSFWLYDRAGRQLTKMFDTRPELAGAPLAPMLPFEIATRDGKTMVSYLTLPPGTDPNGDGIPDRSVPMVLLVHGGPWARDTYGYDAEAQFLANRGYAVLQPNFRGSTGFGKAFVNAGDGEWGRKMHDDLLDAVDWAVKRGVTTSDRVAIMGGSYGGYATLAGLTFTPDRFACGVNIVGPSNLVTLLNTVPPYWEAFRKQLLRRMADPATPQGQAWLKERSPLNFAANIRRPLLVAQGANDPRVKQAESDQIVAAMQAKNIPVTYVLFPDEGHGFARPVNNIAFMAVTENFLQRCLGGRAEPIGNAVAQSSAKVPHGAEYAPGLKDALAAK